MSYKSIYIFLILKKKTKKNIKGPWSYPRNDAALLFGQTPETVLPGTPWMSHTKHIAAILLKPK